MGKYHCTIDLLFDWFGFVCFAIVSGHTADSKPVKQEVNSTVIRPPLVFPGLSVRLREWSRYNMFGISLDRKRVSSEEGIQLKHGQSFG